MDASCLKRVVSSLSAHMWTSSVAPLSRSLVGPVLIVASCGLSRADRSAPVPSLCLRLLVLTSALLPSSMAATSPASRLHRHAMESIFGFLSLEELTVVARVAREWSAATLSMGPLLCAFEAGEQTTSAVFCAGRLRCWHVSTLRLLSIEPSALQLLTDRVPHLTDLGCTVDWVSCYSAVDLLSLPRKLVRLEIRFTFRTHSSWIQPILEAAAQLSLESLFFVVEQPSSHISFSCLQSLRNLRSLTVGGVGPLSFVQLDEIRSLPWLSSVWLGGMDSQSLCHVLRAPHGLQWSYFEVQVPVTPAMGECLASLPLVSLECKCEQSTRWMPLLASTLRVLDVNFESFRIEEQFVESQRIRADLCSLVRLTRLNLSWSVLSSVDLSVVVQSMPQLRDLSLTAMELESFSFLSGPKAPKLLSLSLLSMNNNVLQANFTAELAHIRSQTQLRSLILHCVGNLSPQEQQSFEVPSALLPHLQEFRYSPPLVKRRESRSRCEIM